MRVTALYTAGRNFTHEMRESKEPDHRLVIRGIYGFVRHPSYVGWFLRATGTQIVLRNPVSFVCYFYVSWCFFRQRIRAEEYYLIRFFGNQYIDYARDVWCGLPWMSKLDSIFFATVDEKAESRRAAA